MNINAMECAVEGILFASGEPVKIEKIAEIMEISVQEVVQAAEGLRTYYLKNDRGMMLIELDGYYQLASNSLYFSYISKLIGSKKQQGLSYAALETIAIIAYNQPITRGTIEYIRGVNSDSSVARLLDKGLIEEKGRLNAPGKPILFATTQEFLKCFGLKSLKDLPETPRRIEIMEDPNQIMMDMISEDAGQDAL